VRRESKVNFISWIVWSGAMEGKVVNGLPAFPLSLRLFEENTMSFVNICQLTLLHLLKRQTLKARAIGSMRKRRNKMKFNKNDYIIYIDWIGSICLDEMHD
jgi:hypothetical protein